MGLAYKLYISPRNGDIFVYTYFLHQFFVTNPLTRNFLTQIS